MPQVVLKKVSQLVANKPEEKNPHVHRWINGRIELAYTHLYSCILSVSLLPITLKYCNPYWDLGSGMGLAQ